MTNAGHRSTAPKALARAGFPSFSFRLSSRHGRGAVGHNRNHHCCRGDCLFDRLATADPGYGRRTYTLVAGNPDRGTRCRFAQPFSNYTPPYLYLLSAVSPLTGFLSEISTLKFLSILGATALSITVYRLLLSAGAPHSAEAAAWVFLLPSVALNTAWFAQCDAMWAAACIASVRAGAAHRTVPMLIWAGVALAFKAQAAFLAPFIFTVLFQSRAPVWHWGIPLGTYAVLMFPAWIMGWPAANLATVYFRQLAWEPNAVGNASNPWSYVAALAPNAGANYMWVGYGAALIAVVIYVVHFGTRGWTTREMLAAASLSALMLPFLLPRMHERYFFLADVLTFALAYVGRDKRTAFTAVLTNAASALAVGGFLALSPTTALFGAPLALAALALLVIELARTGFSLAPGAQPTGQAA